MALCPICNKSIKDRSLNATAPFCSARCRQIDLGKWLNEEYRVPVQEEDANVDDDSVDKNESRYAS